MGVFRAQNRCFLQAADIPASKRCPALPVNRLSVRYERACKNAAPFKAEAEKPNHQIEELKEQRKQFKKGGKNDDLVEKIEMDLRELKG